MASSAPFTDVEIEVGIMLQDLKDLYHRFWSRINQLSGEVKRSDSTVRQLQEELERKDALFAAALGEKNDKINELETTINTLRNQAFSGRSSASDAQIQQETEEGIGPNTAKDAIKKLQDELEEKERLIVLSTRRSREYEKNNYELNCRLAEAQRIIADLRRTSGPPDASKPDVRRLSSQFEQMKQTLQNQIATLEEKNDAQRMEIGRLKLSLNATHAEIQGLLSQKENLIVSNVHLDAELQQEYEQRVMQQQEYERMLREQSDEMVKLREELNDLINHISQMASQRSNDSGATGFSPRRRSSSRRSSRRPPGRSRFP